MVSYDKAQDKNGRMMYYKVDAAGKRKRISAADYAKATGEKVPLPKSATRKRTGKVGRPLVYRRDCHKKEVVCPEDQICIARRKGKNAFTQCRPGGVSGNFKGKYVPYAMIDSTKVYGSSGPVLEMLGVDKKKIAGRKPSQAKPRAYVPTGGRRGRPLARNCANDMDEACDPGFVCSVTRGAINPNTGKHYLGGHCSPQDKAKHGAQVHKMVHKGREYRGGKLALQTVKERLGIKAKISPLKKAAKK